MRDEIESNEWLRLRSNEKVREFVASELVRERMLTLNNYEAERFTKA